MEVPDCRSGHVAVAYKGHVIVWGGYNEERFMDSEDVWLYNINKRVWKKKFTQGDKPPTASGSCAAIIESSLYIFAGFSMLGNSNSMHILDLKKFNWIKPNIHSKKPSRRNKLGCWVTGDKIIFFGGYGEWSCDSGDFIGQGKFIADQSQWLLHLMGWNNDLLLYDTVKNEWKGLQVDDNTPCPRAAHACATVDETTGYLFGGRHQTDRLDDLYSLTLDSFQWTEIVTFNHKPTGRSWLTLTAVDDGHLFLYGGLTTNGRVLGDGWIFSVETNEWDKLKYSQCGVKRWHTACEGIYQGQILIFGGCKSKLYEDEEHLNEVVAFQLSPLPLVRLAMNVVATFKEKTCHCWLDLPNELKADIKQLTDGG
ncbi:kelch domain-containing protein 2-like isoform X1 [Styela clava]